MVSADIITGTGYIVDVALSASVLAIINLLHTDFLITSSVVKWARHLGHVV